MRATIISLFVVTVSLVSWADHHDGDDKIVECTEHEEQMPADYDDVVIVDDKGLRWTDLHVVMRARTCMPKSPHLDVQSVKNAKLTCQGKGARLPEQGEVDNLAAFIGRQYLIGRESGQRVLPPLRFMKEHRFFWTATLQKERDRYVYNRALTRLSTLTKSSDMSKAEVLSRPATEDNELRPFLCVFPSVAD